jgi:hypothetical protein
VFAGFGHSVHITGDVKVGQGAQLFLGWNAGDGNIVFNGGGSADRLAPRMRARAKGRFRPGCTAVAGTDEDATDGGAANVVRGQKIGECAGP